MTSETLTDKDVCEGAYMDVLVAVADVIGEVLERGRTLNPVPSTPNIVPATSNRP